MSTPERDVLQAQLHRLKEDGLYEALHDGAIKHGLPFSYVLAIGSRETNLRNILGDCRGGQYHGIGLLQADIQHPEAKAARDDGTWKTHPEKLIDFCLGLLAGNLAEVKRRWPQYAGAGWLKIAASSYNGGLGGAARGVAAGDSDKYTTGHDYGADVIDRMILFDKILQG